MSDEEKKASSEDAPIVYATPTKRVWAWVGVSYMVLILLLVTYYLAKAKFLNGIGPLMIAPALAGIGATAIVQYRTGSAKKGGLPACVAVSAACAVLFLCNLIAGLFGLAANFGA